MFLDKKTLLKIWLINSGLQNLTIFRGTGPWALESEIQLNEFRIPLTIGIRNSCSTDKESRTQDLESEGEFAFM